VTATETCTVLMIGSNAQFIYLISHYIKSTGHEAVVAPMDGDVVPLAAQTKPVMIVMDPDVMESVSQSILQALKANRVTCNLPVLVCSWKEKGASVLAQGADSYLQKPVSYEQFQAVLKDVASIPAA
jgi:chemotaxis family two-component system response regulator PixH